MTTTIRATTVADVAELMEMLRELAAYEQAPPGALAVSEDDLRRDGFGDSRKFEALFAELGGRVVGFVIVFAIYSSWAGKPGLMVHDLFVREECRDAGAGQALIEAVARLAVARGCARVDVNVLAWNRARAFYERLGFEPQPDWVLHRLEGDRLKAFAVTP